jgi:hypothetical protein
MYRLKNKITILNSAEILVLSEWLRQGGCLGEGILRNWLEEAGILDVSDRGILNRPRLERFLAFSRESLASQLAALQLPPDSSLRKFTRLINNPSQAAALAALQSGCSATPQTFGVEAGIVLGAKVFAALRSWCPEGLGVPGYRPPPAERIVWGVQLDLAAGFEDLAEGEDRARWLAYKHLAEGNDRLAAELVASSKIPSMKAWIKRSGGIPALLPAEFRLHLAKQKVRCELFAASSLLAYHFGKRFKLQVDQGGLPGFIIGPTGGTAGPMPFSAAKRLTVQASLVDETVVASVVEFTRQSWDQLHAAVVACSKQQ